jgi:thioredoxin-like negative regulator of GroEL
MLSVTHYDVGLSYGDFFARHGTPQDRARWDAVQNRVQLTEDQLKLLKEFKRTMKVLVLAGAWCGDCANNVPIFENFASVASGIELRYVDRDAHPEVQQELTINGGNRVPVMVFFSEDGHEVGRYGERTLSSYRQLVAMDSKELRAGAKAVSAEQHLADVVADWLREFERIQYILRLSPRLRRLHGD